ncbi:MAG: 16S rRNA (cytidine(1402)-2'-O)-methyltransferase [Acidobacteria bacterium]|nr:16S rRNA (cytidine(1402)-2'-O)-methyltransferase [Acidobacteriota bacterium]
MAQLILAATPIGNLGDISVRLRDALESASHILAEDTRHTRKLLNHLGISRPLRSFHAHSSERDFAAVTELLMGAGTVVYVSDAGMPGISDPGFELVQLAHQHDLEVDVLPGPSAGVTALLLSGLPPVPHMFVGFIPRTQSGRTQLLQNLTRWPMTAIAYESPHRLSTTLAHLARFAGETPIAVCRELTKLHQEVIRGSALEIAARTDPWRGEIVLVLGALEQQLNEPDIPSSYAQLREAGMRHSQALRQLASEHRLTKREIARIIQSTSTDDDG